MKTRFEERKEDLCKACFRLRDAVSQPKNDFTRYSAIKRFEFCYELAWKAIKLYLETKDIDVRNPKDAFKEALVQGLEPVLKPTAPRFSINFGSFFGKIFCNMLNTAAKFCQKVAQNLWKIETRWVLRQALVLWLLCKILRLECFVLRGFKLTKEGARNTKDRKKKKINNYSNRTDLFI